MQLKKKSKQYDGLGFVEALIAIMVSGIVATVLINIAASAMRELIKLDIEDAQAHHARSAAVIVQNMANKERLQDDENIFEDLEENTCYRIDKSGDNYEFYDINGDGRYTEGERDRYKTEAIITDGVNDNEEDYFRIVCIESNTRANADPSDDTNKVFISVIIGFNKVDGEFTSSANVKDYKYYALINL